MHPDFALDENRLVDRLDKSLTLVPWPSSCVSTALSEVVRERREPREQNTYEAPVSSHHLSGDLDMNTIGAFEAKTRFSKLLDWAEGGEEIVVTRRGEPIARISPFTVMPGSSDAQRAMDELRNRANRIGMSVTIDEIREWINEGRT